ncbi:acylneuraminate cytidylyltransferase family protein [bacterium]|nr:acylneuraminate cytidylyltransferase family protein [bacterium]
MPKKILGIITARGGSKRLPGKNIKKFCGKPLLAWSIDVGKKSQVFDRFILSTDDKKIAKIGRDFDIDVPFTRPDILAQDNSGSFEVIKHTVEWLKTNENFTPDWIILLEPPAPGRQPFHIREVRDIIEKKGNNFDSIVGITKIPGHYNPYKSLIRQNDNSVLNIENKPLKELVHRNQDVSEAFFINSAIYAFKTENLFKKEKPSLWGDKTFGYIMDQKYAFDIDTPEDWEIAKIKMKNII